MDNREKAIRGLECCNNDECDNCPYYRSFDENDLGTCRATLHRDALALLKAQEPRVDGKSQEVISGFTQYCPNCGFANTRRGTISPRENTVFYCEKCGTEVKWE